MKYIIGFLPTKPTKSHTRTKNLTGNVVDNDGKTVTAEFTIIENDEQQTLTVKYPFDECKDYFVTTTKKNGLTFHDYCNKLNGFNVKRKGSDIPKWMLFWAGITIETIFDKRSGFVVEDRPFKYV